MQDPVLSSSGTQRGQLFIGCPVWACGDWKGALLTRRAPRQEWLRQYSSVFSTVEGNSTFYALPDGDTVRRWADSTPDGFQFALKFPRTISHEKRLVGAAGDTDAFLEVLTILHEAGRLGPSFLQLPPDFGPHGFAELRAYLQTLPVGFPWSVEVRHHDWYKDAVVSQELDGFLTEHDIDKVVFDTRPLFSAPPSDPSERETQRRKPRVPVHRAVTGRHPFLRIVGRNNLAEVQPWIAEWAPVLREWLELGKSPFVFAHTPDDTFAPTFARNIYESLRGVDPDLPPMPVWPGEEEGGRRTEQLSLF